MEKILNQLEELSKTQNELLADFNRYKGIWGGVLLVLSAMWALFVTFKDWIFDGKANA